MSRRQTTKEDVRAVIALFNKGHSMREISAETGVCLRSVQRLTQQYRDTGCQSLPSAKPKTGRRKMINPRTVNVLKRQVDTHPSITARAVKETNSNLLGQVSLRTVQRCIHDDIGCRRFRARRKPDLTQRHKKLRVNFCKAYQHWDQERWQRVLWSDEAVFTVTGSSGGGVYRRPGSDALLPQYIVNTSRHPPSIMVWACFSFHGVGELVVLPKGVRMNKDNYLELLCDYLPSSFEKCAADYFMQDGAPCHTARDVKQWLRDCQVSFFDDWPSNSPDLNPIENLWSLMKRKVREMDTSTIAKLEAAVRHVWTTLPEDLLQTLANSVPKRLQECLRRKGNPTKY